MATSAIETTRLVGDAGALAEEQADRDRAAGAAERKRSRRRWFKALIRVVSLVVVLAIWQVGGAQLDQSLFSTPSKIVVAGYRHDPVRRAVAVSRRRACW